MQRVKRDGKAAELEAELNRIKRFKRHVDETSVKRMKRQERPPNTKTQYDQPSLMRVKRGSLLSALEQIKRAQYMAEKVDLQEVKRSKRDIQQDPELVRVKRNKRDSDVELLRVKRDPDETEPSLERLKRFKRRAQDDIDEPALSRMKRNKPELKKGKMHPVAASKQSKHGHIKKRMSSPSDRVKHHPLNHKDIGHVVAKAMDALSRSKKHLAVVHNNKAVHHGNKAANKLHVHHNKRNGVDKNTDIGKLRKDMLRLKRLRREISYDLHRGMKTLHHFKGPDMHKRVKRKKQHINVVKDKKVQAMDKKAKN